MKRIITHPFGLIFRNLAVAILISLLALSGTKAYSTIRNAGTETEFNTALSSSVANDIINITNNIVVVSEKILSKNITINGNGYTISVPNPGLDDMGRFNTSASTFRVFTISSTSPVTMNNLTIKGGLVSGAGGAFSVSGVLRMNHCIVSNSRSNSAGGGIVNTGTVYLSNSLINRNASNAAGGFYNLGVTYIENTTFSENRSTSTSGGGGACENSGTLYINNSTISNNQSTEIGGGINNCRGTLYISNSSVTGNVAYGSATGGGIGNNGGIVRALNTLFSHNYHRSSGYVTSPTAYVLDDIIDGKGSQSSIYLYYCIYQASLPSGTNNVIGNKQYTGLQDGSNNTIFSGGTLAKITDGTGTEIGTATLYRPFIYNNNGLVAPTLKAGSFLMQDANKGTQTRFANNNNVSPAIAYYNKSTASWSNLIGTSTVGQLVTTDQIGDSRASIPVVGASETAIQENMYLLKVNANPNGTVNGGTFYGDVYKSGATVTLTAIPVTGYHFTQWNYAGSVGGTGTASTTNPYAVAVNNDITLVPVFVVNGSSYGITYIGNGNTGGEAPATASYSASTTILPTGTLVKAGYTLEGWNTNANGSGTNYTAGSTYSAQTNLTLYAKWTKTLAISADDATLISFTTATIGASITPPEAEVTERGVCWSYTSGVTIANHKTSDTDITGGSYRVALNGLTPGTKVYYVGYYITAAGTVLSDELNFNTLSITTGIGNVSTSIAGDKIKIFGSQGTAIIQNFSNAQGNALIYTLSGQFVRNAPFSANGVTTLSNLKAGVYIVKAKTTAATEVNTCLIIR